MSNVAEIHGNHRDMDESNEMDWDEMSKEADQTESEDEEMTASGDDAVVEGGDEEATASRDKEVTASREPGDQQMAWVMMDTWPAINKSNSGEESRLIPANLHKAAKKGDLKTVKMLLDQGADIESRSKHGMLMLLPPAC